MRHLKRQDGFTLVELVVAIACASMVMAAAAALLLMGARIQRTLRDEAKEQQTVRIVLTMLEDLASKGGFDRVVTTEGGWTLQKGESGTETTVITYENGELSGAGTNNVLLDGLKTAHADLDGQLLTFTFETDQNSYGSSVYCRLIDKALSDDIAMVKDLYTSTGTATDAGIDSKRFEFLKTLCAEYGSTGAIVNRTENDIAEGYKYYSEWYIDGYASHPGWNSSTPWCACFLSWAAAQHLPYDRTGTKPDYIFANVNDGCEKMKPTNTPLPGDYIFFDWEKDGDPDHVGAVLYVDSASGLVYTIEGNSGGRVAIHSYLSNDPRIMGYGVLPWA